MYLKGQDCQNNGLPLKASILHSRSNNINIGKIALAKIE